MKNINNFLCRVPLFFGLSDSNLSRVARLAKSKSFGKNEMICTENSIGTTLYIVLSGKVKIFAQSGERKKILTYLGSGDFFGELALVSEPFRTASAQALVDTEILTIHRDPFRNLVKKDPNVSWNLISALSKRLGRADKEIKLLSFQDVFGRIVKMLLEMSKKHGNQKREIILSLDHNEIAELVGTVREMASRILAQLRKLGCIGYTKGKIIILDKTKLNSLIH